MNRPATESAANGAPGLREVDAAVRSVLGALLRGDSHAREGTAFTGRSDAPEVHAGRLFGVKHAEATAAGIREVQIAPGTVVTPLAKDALKRAGISIRWISRSDASRIRNTGEWGFSIGDVMSSGVVQAFRRSLLACEEAWHELGASLDDACEWVTAAEARGVLVLGAEASKAVYRACQKPGIRAASACEPEAAARAVRALGVNVLVVEPVGKSIATLKQICATFRRAGGPVVPEWFARDPDQGGLQ